jgi:spermidine synthase
VPETEIINEDFSPLGWVAVVRSPKIPLRHVPGMSLNCRMEPPEQLGIFVDGEGLSPITRFAGERESIGHLDCQSSALPYHLLEGPSVLVLGAGGGADVLLAIYHRSKSVDAVEINPQVVRLVQTVQADFAGNIYRSENVTVHRAEARGFIAGSSKLYDLIQVSLLDSYSASAAGGYALNETYLYTVEALQDYLRHLRPGGILAITRWLKMPPRGSLKLFATAIEALKRESVKTPGARLAMIRSWKTTTLLIKNGTLTEGEIAAIRQFCDERSFDVAYYPGAAAGDVNRYNLMDRPFLHEGAVALLGESRARFLKDYKFRIVPATDDKPYFFHFVKLRTLPEIFTLRGKGGMHLLEWTYPVLILTLFQAVVISFVLIILPLLIRQRQAAVHEPRLRIGLYFLLLGLGFLFVEVAFIQKFVLFLGHPLYAISVVLCGFLVFAGLGSGYSARWAKRFAGGREGLAASYAVLGIAVLTLIYLLALPALFHRWIVLPAAIKVPISICLIAPLAFCMGMPFPMGLSRVAAASHKLIPWCWGVNGCASVLSPILAIILAIHLGFTGVVLLALLFYALAALVFLKPLMYISCQSDKRGY